MQRRIMKRQVAEDFLLVPLSKVLVVDDDSDGLEYHSQLLQGQGHLVIPCGSYSIGAALAEKDEYSLVIVSQGSPAFEGREVLERLRSSGRTTPVLVTSRAMDTRCYLEAMRLGAIDYVENPINPADLRRIMRAQFQPSLS